MRLNNRAYAAFQADVINLALNVKPMSDNCQFKAFDQAKTKPVQEVPKLSDNKKFAGFLYSLQEQLYGKNAS